MRRGLLWLALVDLRQAWLRPSLAAVAIGLAIFAVALFARQIDLRRAEVLASYEEAGAATFIADVPSMADGDLDGLAGAIRELDTVRSVQAPYNGTTLGIAADTSFLVFQNKQQKEYLGARTNVLGVAPSFDLARDYYVDFHRLNPQAPEAVLGIPLHVTAGATRAPGPGEVLVASAVADYVGVRPGAEATVELLYTGVDPPIFQRLDGVRLTSTFDVTGPDEGRFDPFWRLAAQGQDALTVRRSNATETAITTLPVVLSAEVIREFLAAVQRELNERGVTPPQSLQREQLVVRAKSINAVPLAEIEVGSLLEQRGLERGCDVRRSGYFCLRLPERNNFQAALQEQGKVGVGGAFFVALLLLLVAIGTAGLEVQTVLTRWHDYGVLQALGFSPVQILRHFSFQLMVTLGGGIIFAALVSLVLPWSVASSLASFAWAAGVSVIAAGFSALPVLVWPLSQPAAKLLRESL